MTIRFVSTSLLALSAVGALATAAAAQDTAVRYRDLDLSSASGAETFRARVNSAARRACLNQRNIPGSNRNGSVECEASFHREIERQLPEAARAQLSGTQAAVGATAQ